MSSIFKAYDIRGLYPQEVNEEIAHLVGLAIAQLAHGGRVVMGRDMRLSSLSLHRALAAGLVAGGAMVDDLELVPIDAMYFAVGKFDYQAGVMVTASHNPPLYNGFKMVGAGVKMVRGREIERLVSQVKPASSQGVMAERDLWPDYLVHLGSFIDKSVLKPLKIIIDAGNGLAGLVIPRLFNGLPFELVPLFFELDGSFPNRPSNPLAEGAARQAAARVRAVKADLGVMFDGDTDRMFLLDEKGNFVSADVTLLLLAQEFLRRQPGSAVVYNLICSRAVPEFIKHWGGRPFRSAVGYANVREVMLAERAVLGGELSAHYSFRDNYYADSGFIALLLVLELLSRQAKPLSELVREYAPYAKAPEINLTVAEAAKVLAAIRVRYAGAQLDELDGITVSYPDWWFNARPSNTEPLLRVTVEAQNAELLRLKQDEVISFIKQLS